MSRSVFALGFQEETQNGELCTEPMSSRNRPESRGGKMDFSKPVDRTKIPAGLPAHPRRSGVKGTAATSGKGLCPAEWNLMLAPVFYGKQGMCWTKEKKNDVLGPAYVPSCELWWK